MRKQEKRKGNKEEEIRGEDLREEETQGMERK